MKIYDVFISYRRSDGYEIAENIYEYLTKKGLRVFWDKHEMIDGHYFDTQIKINLCRTPNVVLIATNDVFSFQPDEDWVRAEIGIAVEEYEKAMEERTITVIQTNDCVFPEEKDLPEEIKNITKPERISYSDDNAFDRVFKAVTTNVSRRNLWHAAHRWLEVSKQPGARFARLDIKNGIMPNTSKEKSTTQELPIHVDTSKDSSHPKPLFQAMEEIDGPVYLIGEGGIGKTTALIHILNEAYMNKEYTKTAQIPIFVELSFAPDTFGPIYKNGKSSFIRRSIYRQLRMDKTARQIGTAKFEEMDTVFDLPEDVAVNPLNDIFTKQTLEPEYILLLDGLNEVSQTFIGETGITVVQMIQKEIMFLLEDCPNVRVILTSRSDDSCIYHDSITRLYLSGVNDEAIRFYLKENEKTEGQIDAAFRDKNLLETLRNPLFLTMYGSLDAIESVSTQGEILHLFFNERRNNLDIYTVQDRIRKIEVEGGKTGTRANIKRFCADIQNFILDFILPRLAYKMEKMGVFYLRADVIQREIEPVLTLKNETDICGTYGKEFFTKYRREPSAKYHTNQVAKEILKKLGDDIEEVAESIIDCCVLSFGILQETGGEFGFTHQHIRDYFAAIDNINMMQLACYIYESGKADVALKCLQPFGEKPVHLAVRKFIGEVLGEHRNKPYFENEKWHYAVPKEPCDRNLLKRVLNVYRNLLEGECEYSLHSIISILREVREDLSGEDLSCLDLRRCSMNGLILGNCDFGASLKGSIINLDTIGDTSHWDIDVDNIVDISTDGKKLLIKSKDKTELWDTNTMLPTGRRFDGACCFTPDGRYIFSINEQFNNSSMRLYDTNSYNWIELKSRRIEQKTLEDRSKNLCDNSYKKVLFLPGGNHALIFRDRSVSLWEIDGTRAQRILEYDFDLNYVHDILYDPIRKRFITLQENAAYVFDCDAERKCLKPEQHFTSIKEFPYFSSTRNYRYAKDIIGSLGKVYFTSDYKYILCIDVSTNILTIIDAETFRNKRIIELPTQCTEFAVDDKYLYSVTSDGDILYISLEDFVIKDCFHIDTAIQTRIVVKDIPYFIYESMFPCQITFGNLKTKTLLGYIPRYSKFISSMSYISDHSVMFETNYHSRHYYCDLLRQRFTLGDENLVKNEVLRGVNRIRHIEDEFMGRVTCEDLRDIEHDQAYYLLSSDSKKIYLFIPGKSVRILYFDSFMMNRFNDLSIKISTRQTYSINFEEYGGFPVIESSSGRYEVTLTNLGEIVVKDQENLDKYISTQWDIEKNHFEGMIFTQNTEYLVLNFLSSYKAEVLVYNPATLELIFKYSFSGTRRVRNICSSTNGEYIAFVVCDEDLKNVQIYEVNISAKEISESIDFVPGVFVENVDFNIANFHELTEEQKKILRQYGAIFDE